MIDDRLTIGRRRACGLLLAPWFGSAFSGVFSADEPPHLAIAKRARALTGQSGLELRLLIPEGCQANLAPIRRSFTALTGIKTSLDVTAVDDVGGTIMRRELSKRRGFCVALPATFDLPTLVRGSLIRPLDEFAAVHDRGAAQGGLYALGDRHGGKLYGYQTDGDAYLLFYDRKKLEDPEEKKRFADQFGRPLAPAKTWSELDELLNFFHRPESGSFGGTLFRNPQYLAWEWWMRIHSTGTFPLDNDMVPRLDHEQGIAATRGLVEASRHLAPGVRDQGLFENWKAFAKGQSLCNLGWGGTQKYLRRNAPELAARLLVTLPPGGKSWRAGYFNWGWNFCVSATCPHPEVAYLFTLFAVCPSPSTAGVSESGGFFDPFRPEHYTNQSVREAYGDQFLSEHRKGLETCIPDFYVSGQRRYFQELTRHLVNADRGRCTPDEAMKRAHRAWEHTTRLFGKKRQVAQWRDLKSRYPTSVTRHLK